ncbi:primosomal protein N' [bacterium]|nr:primosomal protein N' [bacterium]
MEKELNKVQQKQEQGISQKYALCIVDVPTLGTRMFSYLVPEEIKKEISIGQAVLVPFGFRKQNIIAFVAGFSDYLEEGIKAKEIIKIIDKKSVFSLNYLKMLEWISNYYCCDFNTVLQAAIPMKYLKENANQKTKIQKYINFKGKEGATKAQLRVLELLEKEGEVSLTEFEKKAKTTRQTVMKLADKGFAEIREKEIYRNPLNIFINVEKDKFPELSDEQQKVFDEISNKIDNKEKSPILINGITGSGKTEIYFRAIKKVLEEGRNVMFLAPEIALASQLTLRLIKRFDSDGIAVWHSSISDGEKYDVWNKIRDNKIRIIIGARSAVFAPLENIGLIIIDEEHENTYKQTSPAPRYDARKVAQKIAEIHNACIIKGSATPDVEAYFKALSTHNLLNLANRYNNASLAKVSIVDMREEFYKGGKSIYSRTLKEAINETLGNKKQVILLMNRRGFFTNVKCRSCGEVIKCPKCDIPMTYHSSDNTIKCHWCETSKPMPEVCPNCGSTDIQMTGAGTQRIETVTQKLFPEANIERIDSDVLNSKTKYIDILNRFQNGEIDILIGTQMIAKGLDNKNVTLVGVLDADLSFALPDYRSEERGFQLLMQVAGRSGRGEFDGRVIFQTDNPDLYAIQNAKAQNYINFYNNEIERRELHNFPPFCQIIKIVISSLDEKRAQKCAEEVSGMLINQIDKLGLTEYIDVTGAMSCLMHRINSEYRFQIIIRNKQYKQGQYIISKFFQNCKVSDDIKMIIDIDPVDII